MNKHSRDFQRYSFESYNIAAYTIMENKKLPVKLINIGLGGCLIKVSSDMNIDNLCIILAEKQIKMDLSQRWSRKDDKYNYIGFKIKFNDYYNFNLWKNLVHSTQRIELKHSNNKAPRDISL